MNGFISITVSLVELVKKKIVFGIVGLPASLADVITDHGAVGGQKKETADGEEEERDVLPMTEQQTCFVCGCLVASVAVFCTGSLVELKPLLRTVPLMWQTTKCSPVISAQWLCTIKHSRAGTETQTHAHPTQPQRTQSYTCSARVLQYRFISTATLSFSI